MKVQITYLNVNVTQILNIIDQDDHDLYKDLKAQDDASEDGLPDDQKSLLLSLSWVGDLIKKGDFCTTKSPIYKSIDTGKLILPDTQGGIHSVDARLID